QHPFKGWKTILDNKNTWIQYNSVDFGKKALKAVKIRARSETGGTIQISTGQSPDAVIAEIKVPKGSEWSVETTGLLTKLTAQKNLFIKMIDTGKVEIDWIRFE
ncbi:MAG TPA: carbohydrate-binding protein, partial [Flavisolibacter sp.]|nr:carbohydrate-binding protein [Flavisolibacter sp.]